MYKYDPTFSQGQADGYLTNLSLSFMKIIKVEEVRTAFDVFEVTFKPNFFQRLFNIKEKTRQYKDTGFRYTFGGGTVYMDKTGEKLTNGDRVAEAIDKYRRRW